MGGSTAYETTIPYQKNGGARGMNREVRERMDHEGIDTAVDMLYMNSKVTVTPGQSVLPYERRMMREKPRQESRTMLFDSQDPREYRFA